MYLQLPLRGVYLFIVCLQQVKLFFFLGTVIGNIVISDVNISNKLVDIREFNNEGFKQLDSSNYFVRGVIDVGTDNRFGKNLRAMLKYYDLKARHNIFYRVSEQHVVSITNLKSAITRSLNTNKALSMSKMDKLDLTKYAI